ncbi:hypothetical protein O181_076679 [Austropuccinia psidii MF-1]|uniref:Uncharacterized protein n=1 Tax=Austropuccinia psidii MF-1 TaxID=1389203 RepID=A0A9Q3IFM0_9BASI|nr:hypothetical protein [Austropuccinia psidii MF-1]
MYSLGGLILGAILLLGAFPASIDGASLQPRVSSADAQINEASALDRRHFIKIYKSEKDDYYGKGGYSKSKSYYPKRSFIHLAHDDYDPGYSHGDSGKYSHGGSSYDGDGEYYGNGHHSYEGTGTSEYHGESTSPAPGY